ncbi:RadC family protein [Desulfonema magnum]|uniref:DNA repair protein n=1 Tax=Desulfonema magnum TaxID=45655 RepID=A0A975GU27_9BACT|nr:DNA repair protein RadC [Desulfonema magnum]QTA93720.1 Putative DNA repair protein [Desulfonema magnum]
MKKIKELPEFSRPREKLKEKGEHALSDIELIAVILGSGNKGQDVLSLASKVARLLVKHKGSISFDMLMNVGGIGLAKASQILASFELARRYIVKESIRISEPREVVPLLTDIADKQQEYFVCISLNGANEVIEKRIVTVGLLNKTQVHPREVFADVITDRAASVILSHNHPSGELRPSNSDLKIHHQLTEAGKILGITVLDHIIISKKGYYSFQEQGII